MTIDPSEEPEQEKGTTNGCQEPDHGVQKHFKQSNFVLFGAYKVTEIGDYYAQEQG